MRPLLLYDAVHAWLGTSPEPATETVDSPRDDAVRPPTRVLGGVDGTVAIGEVATVSGGRPDDRAAFAYRLALGAAVAGVSERPNHGVQLLTSRDPRDVARWFAHVAAQLPFDATSSRRDIEHAADAVSQLPIWIRDPRNDDGVELADHVRRCRVPIRVWLHVVEHLRDMSGAGLEQVVAQLGVVATAAQTAVVVLVGHGTTSSAATIELVERDGEIRPAVRRLLPLRRALSWPGFEEFVPLDEALLAMRLRDDEGEYDEQ